MCGPYLLRTETRTPAHPVRPRLSRGHCLPGFCPIQDLQDQRAVTCCPGWSAQDLGHERKGHCHARSQVVHSEPNINESL